MAIVLAAVVLLKMEITVLTENTAAGQVLKTEATQVGQFMVVAEEHQVVVL